MVPILYNDPKTYKGKLLSLLVLFLTALGLSMDAFTVAVCLGLGADGKRLVSTAFKAGAYFGVFQALMPLAGFFLGAQFADKIARFDHWIAFVLLAFIGAKMIKESFNVKEEKEEVAASRIESTGPRRMITLAVATSIDALAVGVSLALLQINIIRAALFIGSVTFVVSLSGVLLGRSIGLRLRQGAELAGGGILVLIGLKILIEGMVG
jgi:putative Mn2+ efflux pump MntP